MDAVAQGVIPADGHQVIDPQKVEALQDLRGEVVERIIIGVPQMVGNLVLGDVARAGSGGVEEGSSGPAHTVDDLFGEQLAAVLLVELPVPNVGDYPFPAPAKPDHLEAFPDRPNRDGPDGRVKAGNVPSPGQDADGSFFSLHGGHAAPPSSIPVMPVPRNEIVKKSVKRTVRDS